MILESIEEILVCFIYAVRYFGELRPVIVYCDRVPSTGIL